jgi:hypothetical protein
MTDKEAKLKAKLVSRDQLVDLVGPDSATGVVRAGCSAEDWRLFQKHVNEQGQPSKPNRASRRQLKRVKQRARRRRA